MASSRRIGMRKIGVGYRRALLIGPSLILVSLAPLAPSAQEASAVAADRAIESCVQRELVRPDIKQADIRSPGKLTQTENIDENIYETPQDCRGVVKRDFQLEVIVKQLLNIHGKARHIKDVLYRWYEIHFTKEEAGSINLSLAVASHDQGALIHCSLGKAKTTAMLVNRGTIRDPEDHHILGRQLWRKPFKILGRPKGCPPGDKL